MTDVMYNIDDTCHLVKYKYEYQAQNVYANSSSKIIDISQTSVVIFMLVPRYPKSASLKSLISIIQFMEGGNGEAMNLKMLVKGKGISDFLRFHNLKT